MRVTFYVCCILIIVSNGMAYALSASPPTIMPFENRSVIDRIDISGGKRFTPEQLKGVLSQQTGLEISLQGVTQDLRALAALYRTETTADVEAWSGLELITSQVTVSSAIEHSKTGHVVIIYNVKEWFPHRN